MKSADYNNTKMELTSYSEMFKNVKNRNEGAFIPFIVAGDPNFETSLEIVQKYVENGADAIEIGFPFSDPIADGPTVQAADIRSLDDGMNTKKCFEFISRIREFSTIPIGVLVYYNLIYKMGIENFYRKARESGITGILAADLPPEEADEAVNMARKIGIDQIFMVAQTTTNERLKKIVELCSGFIYVVAVMGVTGARSDIVTNTIKLIKNVKSHTDLPIAVGFGISKPAHVNNVINAGSDGAIVASAIINIINKNLDDIDEAKNEIGTFCSELKKATHKTN